jgi:hypothetical protein
LGTISAESIWLSSNFWDTNTITAGLPVGLPSDHLTPLATPTTLERGFRGFKSSLIAIPCTFCSAFYHNIVRRRGKKRALVALAHRMLIDIYHVLKTGEPYQDAGAEAVCERTMKRRERSMIRSLEKAGYSVVKRKLHEMDVNHFHIKHIR